MAQTMARALTARGNGEAEVTVADPFTGRDLPSRMTRLYGGAITRTPWLWGLLYRVTDRSRCAPALAAPLERAVGGLLPRHRPDLVVSVHPMCHGAALRALRRLGADVPVAVQVTDLLDIHAAWHLPQVSLLLAPTVEAAEQVVARGYPEERVHALGLPVDDGFRIANGDREHKAGVRSRLGLDPEKPTVLLTGGGEGAGPVGAAARTVVRALPGAQVIAVCGRNRALRRRLSAAGLPGRVLGFVDGMSELMQACDVVVAKAGAVTVAEAVAARRPLLIMGALPGQEQGNLRYVLRSDIGAYAPPGPALAAALRALDSQGYRPVRWLENMERVDRPHAQEEAADLLLDLAMERSGERGAIGRFGRPTDPQISPITQMNEVLPRCLSCPGEVPPRR